MLLDRALFERTRHHLLTAIENANPEARPFPHVLIERVFPEDVYHRLRLRFPNIEHFNLANTKHHTNGEGRSTRRRLSMTEQSFQFLSDPDHQLWATIRAVISCQATRQAVFAKLSWGLCRRFGINQDKLSHIPAYPRSQLYQETNGYHIAPHPDTRDKIVTMQFALPIDRSLKHAGTEFYQRSLNPIHALREPRGFITCKTMPFVPNNAYAFVVLNRMGLKSWHGRTTLPDLEQPRDSLLHAWYTESDESEFELDTYWNFLGRPISTVANAA